MHQVGSPGDHGPAEGVQPVEARSRQGVQPQGIRRFRQGITLWPVEDRQPGRDVESVKPRGELKHDAFGAAGMQGADHEGHAWSW